MLIDPAELYSLKVPIPDMPESAGKRYWTYWFRRADKMQVCGGGKTRGRVCNLTDVHENGRCHKHGGTRKRALPTTGKNARKAQIGHLLITAEERAKNEKRVLDLLPGIAAYDIRLEELAEAIEAGDSPKWRKALRESATRYRRALMQDDEQETTRCRGELFQLIEDGWEKGEAWRELMNVLDRRAVRAEKANELKLKGEDVITRRQLAVAAMKMIQIALEEGGDVIAARIHARFDREVLAGDAKVLDAAPLALESGE